MWALAHKMQDRVLSGKKRLKLFPLWKRVFLFWKFSKIRKIILSREMRRSNVVLITLGMTKRYCRTRYKRRINGHNSQN